MAAFNPRAFMRRVGVARLARYFAAHPPAPCVVPDGPDAYDRALGAMAASARAAHLAVFARIDDVANGPGIPSSFTRRASGDPAATSHERAMDLFVDAPQAFAFAEQIDARDVLAEVLVYRVRSDGPRVLVAASARKAAFRAQLAREATDGARVLVEDHDEGTRVTWFVYVEDEARALDVVTGPTDAPVVTTRTVRPLRTLVLVYSRADGRLRVHAPTRPLAERARDAFAKVYLGDVHAIEPEAFDFAPIAAGVSTFRGHTHPLRDATVIGLTLRVQGDDAGLLTLQPRGDLQAFLRAHVRFAVDARHIESVRLRVRFAGPHGDRLRTVVLRRPDVTNLRDDARDRLIEAHLVSWQLLRASDVRDAVAMHVA